MLQVHSNTEQNLSYNFETLHHARPVKSSAVVIIEDNKHIVVRLFKSLTMITGTGDILQVVNRLYIALAAVAD